MSAAEELFEPDDEWPPWWIDTVFIITICIVHIAYGIRFTTFSLAYIHAKCEEKDSGSKWSESKLYLHAVHAAHPLKERDLVAGSPQDMLSSVSAELWRHLRPCRLLLRAILFFCGWITLLFWTILMVNLMYDYLVVAVIVRYGYVSFLALLIIPLWVFANVGFGRYLVFGIMALWDLNVMC